MMINNKNPGFEATTDGKFRREFDKRLRKEKLKKIVRLLDSIAVGDVIRMGSKSLQVDYVSKRDNQVNVTESEENGPIEFKVFNIDVLKDSIDMIDDMERAEARNLDGERVRDIH